MIALQAVLSWDAALGLSKNLMALLTSSLLACVALGLLALTAWLSASTTLYTITNKRIVMRIGIVLTLTFNLPFSRIQAAQIKNSMHGKGDIALDLQGPDRIAYLHLWPHARPFCINNPEPMLRNIANVKEVATIIANAWAIENQVSLVQATAKSPMSSPDRVKSSLGVGLSKDLSLT
jgi:hypothetical protein